MNLDFSDLIRTRPHDENGDQTPEWVGFLSSPFSTNGKSKK